MSAMWQRHNSVPCPGSRGATPWRAAATLLAPLQGAPSASSAWRATGRDAPVLVPQASHSATPASAPQQAATRRYSRLVPVAAVPTQAAPAAGHQRQSKLDEYLASLSKEQWEAVTCPASAVRVKAGPGSGKTRVVTARVAWLLSQQGVKPRNMLVITFTNKAAGELKERIEGVLGPDVARLVTAGTFHSICCRLLRQGVQHLNIPGLNSNFTIFDEDDAEVVMNKAVASWGGYEDSDTKKIGKLSGELMESVGTIKNLLPTTHGVKLGEVYAQALKDGRIGKPEEPLPSKDAKHMSARQLEQRLPQDLAKIHQLYEKELHRANAVDFNDLLGLTVALLQAHLPTLTRLQAMFQHICVDEFQDTNGAQYELVRMLREGATSGSLFVVGDPDQAIYGWRGANPVNMETHFAKDFSGTCKTVFLLENYRSGQHILHAAEAILAHDGLPALHKPLKAMRPVTGHVRHVTLHDEHHEAEHVVEIIETIRKTGRAPGYPDNLPPLSLKDVAVVYRTRIQSKPFSQLLASKGIPYKVFGDVQFWQRAEVKDVMAYLRLAANPTSDSFALGRIAGRPSRGLGPKTLSNLEEAAERKGCSLASLLLSDCTQVRLTKAQTAAALQSRTPWVQAQVKKAKEKQDGSGSEASSDSESQDTPELLGLAPDNLPALKAAGVSITAKAADGLQELRDTVVLVRNVAAHMPLADTVTAVLAGGRYIEHLLKDRDMENIEVLQKLMQASAQQSMEEEDGLGLMYLQEPNQVSGSNLSALHKFLEQAQLLREATEEKTQSEYVSLMTMHAAKGLEFRVVFIAGCEEGRMPSSMSDAPEELAEEKRLAYVGATRAKDALYMLTCQERTWYGRRVEPSCSRYIHSLKELAGPYVTSVVASGGHRSQPHHTSQRQHFRGQGVNGSSRTGMQGRGMGSPRTGAMGAGGKQGKHRTGHGEQPRGQSSTEAGASSSSRSSRSGRSTGNDAHSAKPSARRNRR